MLVDNVSKPHDLLNVSSFSLSPLCLGSKCQNLNIDGFD